MPASRPCAPPIDVASIAHERSPASSISRKQALQVDRLGRVEADRPLLPADDAPDVREQRGPPAGGLEDRVEQERGRRLAVRPGHRRDLERVGRPAEELGGRRPHRSAHARHDELWHVEVEPTLDDERDSAPLDRLRCEVVAVDRVAPGMQKKTAPGVTARVS